MRALVVDPALTPPAAASRLRRRRMALPTAMPVEVRDIRTPIPQGPGWVLVRPALSGICGTDLALIEGDPMPNVLTAFGQQAAVIPGHEIVGVVERAGHTRWAREGHRVLESIGECLDARTERVRAVGVEGERPHAPS